MLSRRLNLGLQSLLHRSTCLNIALPLSFSSSSHFFLSPSRKTLLQEWKPCSEWHVTNTTSTWHHRAWDSGKVGPPWPKFVYCFTEQREDRSESIVSSFSLVSQVGVHGRWPLTVLNNVARLRGNDLSDDATTLHLKTAPRIVKEATPKLSNVL